MWEIWNESKTIKELYFRIGTERFEKTAEKLLKLWCILPLIIAFLHVVWKVLELVGIVPIYTVTDAYRDLMHGLGILSLVLWVLFVIGRFLLVREHIGWMVKKEPWHFLLLGMLLWSVFATLLSDNPWHCFWGSEYRFDGLRSYFFYAAVMALAFMITSDERRCNLMRLHSGVANVMAVIMMCQEWKVPGFGENHGWLRTAVFYNPNHLAYYLCMSIMCLVGLYVYAVERKWQIYFAVSFAFQVYVLIVNSTFGCYLAVLVGMAAMIFLLWRSDKKYAQKMRLLIGIVLLLSIMSFLGWIPSSENENLRDNFSTIAEDANKLAEQTEDVGRVGNKRWICWTTAVEMIAKKPLFGYGPEMWWSEYAMRTEHDRPHNEYLQHAGFLGIPALLMYLAALITLFIHQWKNLPKLHEGTIIAAGAVVAYLFSALFGNTMFYTTPYFFMLLGFAAGRPRD